MGDILIACHCPSPTAGHKPLYINPHTDESTPLRTGVAGIKSIQYIDDEQCPGEGGWDAIPSSSKDMIWSIGCPVYPVFTGTSDAYYSSPIIDMLDKLRINGTMYISIKKEPFTEAEQANAIDNFRNVIETKLNEQKKPIYFTVNIVPKAFITPFVIDKEETTKTHYFLIKKSGPRSVGGYRKKRTRRNRRKVSKSRKMRRRRG